MSNQSETKSPRKSIKIVGIIASPAYQRAKACAEILYKHSPRTYMRPKMRGMMEFDWDENLTKQRRKFGGRFWLLVRPVAVYVAGQFVGDDEVLVAMVKVKYALRLTSRESAYQEAIRDDYTRFLVHTKRVHVFLDIWIDRKQLGRLVFQLYSDLLPTTCHNFRCLCTGEISASDGRPLSYRGTEIHRVCKLGWIQGGDIGCGSVYGATFPDESYCVSHERRGVLSMANDGRHSNASQFFVTLQPALWMDRHYVAFGQLVEGVEVLKAIENVDTFYERPEKRVYIKNCGVLFDPEISHSQRVKNAQEEERKREAKKMEEEPGEEVIEEKEVDSDMNVARYMQGIYYLKLEEAEAEVEEEEAEVEEDNAESMTIDMEIRFLVDRCVSAIDALVNPLDEADIAYLVNKIVSAATVNPLEEGDICYLVEKVIESVQSNSEIEASKIIDETLKKVETIVLERAHDV